MVRAQCGVGDLATFSELYFVSWLRRGMYAVLSVASPSRTAR